MSDNKTRRWPNLSSYGVTLGIIEFAGSKSRLVFADETGKYGHIARNLAFQRTRWPGLWVRDDTRVEPSTFRPAFPLVKVEERSNEDIANEIRIRIEAKIDESRQQQLPGFSLSSEYLVGVQRGPRVFNEKGEILDLPAMSIVSDATLLGLNYMGEDVFQARDGKRFIRVSTDQDSPIIMEGARIEQTDDVAGRYMRGNTPRSLSLAADGFVRAMAEGRIARVEDFATFFRAVNEREMADQDIDIGRIAREIDGARVRRLSSLARNPDADVFGAALRLHEAAQYYNIVADKMTPLPVGVMMQHIAATMPEGSTVRIGNASNGEFGIFVDGVGGFKLADAGQTQDILLSAYPATPMERSFEVLGTAVSRLDHAEVLKSLEQMSENGLGIFVIGGDNVPGRIGPSSRRFLDALATHYKIEGIVDMDGALTGTAGAPPQRVIVVGAKHEIPGHGGLPSSLPYVTDYEALWDWGNKIADAIKKPGSVSYSARGGVSTDVVVEHNAYQAPYIPTSMLSDPAMMVPRNMASPLRRAMIDILREEPHIDEFLARELGKQPEELKGALSAEQADAVVLGLKRLESGLGFMEADQTGVGKGRVLAALALASKRRGEPVVFLTEKSDLFTDFWRDLEDIGADKEFKNVFVMNADTQVTSTLTGELVAQSAPREKVVEVLRSMTLPEDADLIFATYSQFNRDPIKAIQNSSANIALTQSARTAISAKAQKMIDWVQQSRRDAGKKLSKEVVVEAFDVLTDASIIPSLPTEALKSLWIGKAVPDATLIMDESHIAAGEVSQTTLNLGHAVMRAKNVIYSSATFARGERSMRIYRRLFPASVDVEGLHETLKKGGEALQEALTSMLAEDGALVRREHDLSMLKFVPVVDTKHTKRNEKLSDQLAEIMSLMTALSRETREYTDAISDEMKQKLIDLHSDAKGRYIGDKEALDAVGVVNRSSIGNPLYTIMRTFITILKTDVSVQEAVDAMRQGKKPVFVVQHTLEAELNRAVSRAKDSGQFQETEQGLIINQPSFRQVLLDTLESLLKVQLDGKELELEKAPKFAAIVREIEKKIRAFPELPTSPMDVIRQGIEREGFKMAELSGRKRRVTYLGNGKALVENIGTKERKQAVTRFNHGDAQAVMLTPAGNSGISLHASPKFANDAQRVMIEVEVPEDIVVRTQFFGRVNRNGQKSHPEIRTVSSGLPAEDRVLALSNNRLRKMSASVTGNRDNAALTRDIADILNTLGNQVAFRFLEARPELARKLDINLAEKSENEDGDFILYGDKYVSELMQRLVLLKVSDQREIIEEITTEFNNLVEELDAMGQNPLRPTFYDVHAKKVKTEVIEAMAQSSQVVLDEAPTAEEVAEFGDVPSAGAIAPKKPQKKSAFDKSVNMTDIEYTVYFEPMPSKMLKKELRNGETSFLRSVGNSYGEEVANLARENPDAFFDNLLDIVIERGQANMEKALSKKHATVADALAADGWNAVKTIQHSSEQLAQLLTVLRVGTTFSFSEFLTGEKVEHAVVTGISVPKEFLAHYPGRYQISYATPGKPQIQRTSLNAMMKMQGLEIKGPVNAETLKAFESGKSGSYETSRSVLDGNLFRAAEMSMQAGVGTQATYTDVHGLSNRAVVLPYHASAKSFSHLPLRLQDPNLVAQFFREVEYGKLYSLSGAKDEKAFGKVMNRGIQVKRDKTDLIVSVPGTEHWAVWLRNHPELMAVTGPFAGTREALFATVPMAMADDLFREVYKTGTTMYAHSDTHASVKKQNAQGKEESKYMSAREWFVQRIGIQEQKVKSTNDVSEAFDGAVDPMDAKMGPGRTRQLAA